MKVNYDQLSQTYDTVRSEDRKLVSLFLTGAELDENRKVLDFGCGTGNYANALQSLTHAQIYGVEPSDGMREKAALKNPALVLKKGDHTHIPFDSGFFDFAYMTDVIHHVPDLPVMFGELGRVLKKEARLCILTQSHAQIEGRFYTSYFPSTATADQKRYPDLDEIMEKAGQNGFKHLEDAVWGEGPVPVGQDFVALVERKGYSMFHLIPEQEYLNGLERLKADVSKGGLVCPTKGSTLMWFYKL